MGFTPQRVLALLSASRLFRDLRGPICLSEGSAIHRDRRESVIPTWVISNAAGQRESCLLRLSSKLYGSALPSERRQGVVLAPLSSQE